jgi:hypothetical protein
MFSCNDVIGLIECYDDVEMRCQYCINGNTSDDDSFALLLFARLLQYGSNDRSQVVIGLIEC